MNDCFCVNNFRYKYKYKENIQNMSDGRKRILSPFTGCKIRKAWNRTKEKSTGLEEFLDRNGAFYNGNKSDNDDES